MRCPAAAIALAVLLCSAVVARADEPATTTTAPPSATNPTQTTEVAGNAPDLTGHWFVHGTLQITAGDQKQVTITNAIFWDVARTPEGRQTITVRFVSPPDEVNARIDAANKSRVAWTPTQRDLQLIRRNWDGLAPASRGISTVATRFLARDAFDEALKSDAQLKDGQWAVVQVMEFERGGGRPIKEIDGFSALERTEHGWRGNYLSATIAAAPFIVPITFRGTFEMYRLDELPEPGLLERIMNVFSGCGRRS